MEKTILTYFRKIKLKVSKKYFQELLKSNPEYPSLLSIADTFEQLGLNYRIAEIKKVESLHFPLLIVPKSFQTLLLINTREEYSNQINDSDNIYYSINVNPAQAPINAKNRTHYYFELASRIIQLAMFSILCLSISWVIVTGSVFNTLMLLTSAAGLYIGLLLFAKDVGFDTQLVDKVCSYGKSASCNHILRSNASQLFGFAKVSDLVLIYFSCHFLFWLIPPLTHNTAILATVEVFTLSSLVSIPYSLYYQIKMRKYCVLCLGVVGALLLQNLLVFTFGVHASSISFNLATLFAIAFLALLFLLVVFKHYLKDYLHLPQARYNSLRVKNQLHIFLNQLQQKAPIPGDNLEMDSSFQIGLPEAPVVLTVVANLHCQACKEMHDKIKNLVNLFPTKLGCVVRLLPNEFGATAQDSAFKTFVGYHLHREDLKVPISEILDYWYKTKDIKQLTKRYPLKSVNNIVEFQHIINQYLKWAFEMEIRNTPSLFVNNFPLPQNYSVDDLLSIISPFSEMLYRNEINNQTMKSKYVSTKL